MKPRLLLVALFASAICFAQDSTAFRIKDYKFRTPGFQALVVQLNASGSVNQSGRGSSLFNESKTVNLSPSAVGYYRIRSTDSRLHESSINLSPTYYFQSRTENDRRRQRYFRTDIDWNRNDRFYKPGLFFFEVGNRLSASVSSQRFRDTASDFNSAVKSVSNTLVLGLGRGRIERVQDAQMAVFILNDLAANGLLDRPVDAETAYRFASLITDINNRRIFDFRRRRIYELTRLDSFLRNNGLSAKPDVRHFAVLNDNWAFAVNPWRLSGSNWYVRLQPTIGFSGTNGRSQRGRLLETSEGNTVGLALSPTVGFERYVPKNLKWQFNRGISLAYTAQEGRSLYTRNANGVADRFDFTGRNKLWTLRGFYGLGFFPNTRTFLQANVEIVADRIKEERPDEVLYVLQPTFQFSTGYFLGYRTFLTANVNANGRYDRTKFGAWTPWYRSVSLSGSLGFTHALF